MKKLLLLLLFLVSFSSALECTEVGTDILLGDQAGNIYAVIILTIVVIAIAYMAGAATSNPSLTIFAKDEIYHLFISVMLIVCFSGVLMISCTSLDFFFMNVFSDLDSSLSCYDSGVTMTGASDCYLSLAVSNAEHVSAGYIREYIRNIMWSSISVTIALPMTNQYSSVLSAYKRIISNQYDMILNTFIIPSLMSLKMQQLIINFVSKNIIPWVVPTAFLLRVFVPTRQMGNSLLALALGVYLILPYLYTFNLAMYEAVLTDSDCMREVAPDLHYYDVACDSVLDHYECWSYDGSTPHPENTCSNPYGFWGVARLIPQAFLLPNLAIALMVAFIGSLNKALRMIG